MRKYDVRMPLYEIRLSVEGGCNYDCIYCGPFADGKKALGYGAITLEQVDKIGRLIKKYDFHVQITGGEPSLRYDLDEIVASLKLANVEDIGLSTNGSRLDRDYISKMIKNGLKEIHFHIPSLNQKIYEKTVRNNKQIKEVIDLSLYSKEKIKVEYNTPVTHLNISTLSELLDFSFHNSINLKLIEEVSLSSNRIKEKEIEESLENWLNKNNIQFGKKIVPRKYGHIYETDKGIIYRIAPVTPNLIEHIKGKPQDILLDGRFWIGGENEKYVYTPSYFLKPKVGTFKDLEKALEKTMKIYKNEFN